MRSGQLKHRVIIDQPALSQGSSGEELITWQPFAELWASIEPLRGKEGAIANQTLAQLDTRIRIRWSPNVDQIAEKWRVRHQGTIYNIVSLVHVNYAQREIELMCLSGLNNG